MTVRIFVTSAGFMIFCWLAATFLRAVPMETYPVDSVLAVPFGEESPPVLATSAEKAPGGVTSESSATQ